SVCVESGVADAKNDTLPTNGMGAPRARRPIRRNAATASYCGPATFLGPWSVAGAPPAGGREPPPPLPLQPRSAMIATATIGDAFRANIPVRLPGFRCVERLP